MMRFLCLHGRGTNSKIFEQQTATLRHELGDEHEYHFIEGTIPSDPAPELTGLGRQGDGYFAWVDTEHPDRATVAARGLEEIDEYVADEGPFDAVLAFCQGAAAASSYMVHKARLDPGGQHMSPVFACAVFMSGVPPIDLEALSRDPGDWRSLEPHGGPVIRVPTVSVWGSCDQVMPGGGEALSLLCDPALGEVVVHGGGHEVVGRKDPAALKATVKAIRRMMDRALIRR